MFFGTHGGLGKVLSAVLIRGLVQTEPSDSRREELAQGRTTVKERNPGMKIRMFS